MIFSTKAEYGVRLMVQLGLSSTPQPLPLKAIANAEQLPLAYLEHIVAHLKRAGLVTSARGLRGGYQLCQPIEAITMEAVIEALEGPIMPMACFEPDAHSRVCCSHSADSGRHCATKLLWLRVQNSISAALAKTTLAELVDFTKAQEKTTPELKNLSELMRPAVT